MCKTIAVLVGILSLTGCVAHVDSSKEPVVGVCYRDTTMDGKPIPRELLEIDKVEEIKDGKVYYSYTFPFDEQYSGHWAHVMGDTKRSLTSDTVSFFMKYHCRVRCPW